jgi:hypothetical protein
MTGVRRGTEARGYGVYKASGGGAVRFVSHRTGTGKASGFPGSGKVVSLQWVSDLSADYANAPHLTGRWRPGEPVICYW